MYVSDSYGIIIVLDNDYRLLGENKNYGTPVNPQNPCLFPGGSSSGSAVAVAAHLVDFALGTFFNFLSFSITG